MRRMVSSLLAVVSLAIVAVAPEAKASNITWLLSDVTPFESGQTAKGFFSVNQRNGSVVDWNITITGGSTPALTDLKFSTNMIGCVAFCVIIFDEDFGGPVTGIQFRTPLASDNTIEEFTIYISAIRSEVISPSSPELLLRSGDTNVDKALFIPPNILENIDGDGLLGDNATLTLLTFAGTPKKPDCYGKSVSGFARQYGSFKSTVEAIGFSNARALRNAIRAFCEG